MTGHTRIIVNNEEIGYMMPNRSQYRKLGDNWFVSIEYNDRRLTEFYSNRNKVISQIREFISNNSK